MTALRRWMVAWPVLGVIVACGERSSVEERVSAGRSDPLIGTWDVRVELERPPLLTERGDSPVRVVQGQIAFLANRSLDASYPQLATPTNNGTFDIDFTPFGFEPRDRHRTPSIVAGWVSDDSVEMILAPDENQTVVTMRGRYAGDTIAGTWNVSIARVGGGGGRFLMLRRREQ